MFSGCSNMYRRSALTRGILRRTRHSEARQQPDLGNLVAGSTNGPAVGSARRAAAYAPMNPP